MSIRRTLTFALLLAAAVPGTAWADGVRIVEREEPIDAVRLSVARPAPLEFTLVGIHWQGPGEISFRTAGEDGEWSAWLPARPEDEDHPDLASPEAGSPGWNVGNPWWTGGATRIQYQSVGTVTRLRAFFVSSPVTPEDEARADSLADTSATATSALRATRPAIVMRKDWKADESIVKGTPALADRLSFSVVHHTAGTNSYSAAESAAIVRGIQRYHVLGNGWNDIGYNFLVDKYGQIFEGRKGGVAKNVIGAHAGGFNTGSVGVALLGTYGSANAPAAARRAIERLLAWRLDVAHVDPLSLVDAVSFGNERYKAGVKVRLRAVSGHRDTGYTSCPGDRLYGQLGTIATNAAAIGLPKLYEPQVTGGVGGPVRFTARLSSARPWTVQVRLDGAVVAEGAGNGAAVDWTWDSTGTLPAPYTYRIDAGSDTRPATGPVPGPPPLAVTGLKAKPAALTPNGDWSGEKTRVSFTLSRQASVGARVVEASSGALVRTILATGLRPAGPTALTWAGQSAAGVPVPDGRYRVEVTATADAEHVTRSAAIVVDRTLGAMGVAPAAFSPNDDGRADQLELGFALTRPAEARVEIRRNGKVVRRLSLGTLAAGAHSAVWDGTRANGQVVADGTAKAVVLATTSLGTRKLARPIRVDTTRPVLRILSLKQANGRATVRFTLSEDAVVHVWFGVGSWREGRRITVQKPAGTRAITRRVTASVVRLLVFDEALNKRARVFRSG
ncbi:MAG TPA: FlgD immunoglobulin-like domain containing protein [Gaiellaceae bacterium]|nr:FlgD immunoglobulin-like domain containing protein [Gaiellaceae bacterium]